MKETKPMMRPQTWETFRATGLLWWINRILHTFGWAITIVLDDDGTVLNAYPARVRFRGFSEESESAGFINVTGYMASQADTLAMEIEDEEE